MAFLKDVSENSTYAGPAFWLSTESPPELQPSPVFDLASLANDPTPAETVQLGKVASEKSRPERFPGVAGLHEKLAWGGVDNHGTGDKSVIAQSVR